MIKVATYLLFTYLVSNVQVSKTTYPQELFAYDCVTLYPSSVEELPKLLNHRIKKKDAQRV